MLHFRYLVKFFLVVLAAYGVLSSPALNDEPEEISKESKRDVSGAAISPLLKSAIFNPYLYQPFPPIIPGKPFFYPLLTPPDILLNRFAKSTVNDEKIPPVPTLQATSPDISSYFKIKKDEFLTKLFDKLNNATDNPEIATRSVTETPEDTEGLMKPTVDPSFFLNKKLDFLEKLFKTFNNSTTTPSFTESVDTTATTPKPTIVPPNFWFPFIKPPKPPKAPKPTKPPKAKKILKDALDTVLLQSLLMDLGIDPTNTTFSKRAVIPGAKKAKSKKVKPEDTTEFHIPSKVDPSLYSAKASDCLDKLFKILGKADAEDLSNFIEPKATVIPTNMWMQPSEIEYTSKLDAFLDLLFKSLNATEEDSTKKLKPNKPELVTKKIGKRSTFLDELLHRIPPTTTTTVEPDSSKCDCVVNPCCCGKTCSHDDVNTESKTARSLIFKPFGTGYWIPQYLYASKMSLYLDKLMDTINTAAVEDVSSDGSSLKRSIATVENKINATGLSAKEAALTLLIAELTDLKNDIVEAFDDGIKAQKSSAVTKPYNPAAKSFKKPFWGPKPSATPDPVEPIQKRVDILNDIFDKLAEVEKTLLFADESENAKVFKNIKDTLEPDIKTGSPKLGSSKLSRAKVTETTMQDSFSTESPDYLREFLQNLYASKLSGINEVNA